MSTENKKDLTALREEISAINDEMLDLFLQRMNVSAEIAEYKKAHDLPILDKSREREIFADVEEKAGDLGIYAHRFFSNMMELSRAWQNSQIARETPLIDMIKESRLPADALFPRNGIIGVAGVEGAFAQQAADNMFPRGTLMFMKSFEAVFDALENGECQYGIVPVENSSYGSVKDVYRLLEERDVYITRSIRINVRHELLANPGTKLSEIREIYSHEQAIGQCGAFLRSLPGSVKIIPVANTAVAAKMVGDSDRTDVAAIASHEAGKLYNLKTVRDNIMDSANNYTRFISIRTKPAVYPGANRISVIFTTEHRPGALYDIIAMVTALGLNMVKLESVPLVGSDFEFAFYMDLHASVWEEGVLEMLAYMERTCDRFKYLGNYPEVS